MAPIGRGQSSVLATLVPIARVMMIVVALLLTAPAAHASVIYDWTGTCVSNCSGTATATLILKDSYVPGNTLTPYPGTTETVELDVFMPSDGTYPDFRASLISPWAWAGNPLSLPVLSGPGSGGLFVFGGFVETSFLVFPDGSWEFGNGLIQNTTCNALSASLFCEGTSSNWVLRSTVPEPSTHGLVLLALGAMGLLTRRRHAVVLSRD